MRAGLATEMKRIGDIARETVPELQTLMAGSRGKRVYVDYCSVIDRYIMPYFKNRYITTITVRDTAEFEAWCNERLGRTPEASTLLTIAAAWQRILDLLDDAADPQGLKIPGLFLHPLKGDRKGQWAMSVSGNWRITFAFDGEDVIVVNLEDYQ